MKLEHKTGWTSCVYGDEKWHRTKDAACNRAAYGFNGTGQPPDGVWCCVTGQEYKDCHCEQCERTRYE